MSRACIPFHILFDKDLSKNELIIYGMIEHMESDDNPVFFNNRSIAEKLGVSHESRCVGKMLTNLKNKGYIIREQREVTFKNKNGTERKETRWCFNTAKNYVISQADDDSCQEPDMVPEIPSPMVPQVPPPPVPEIPPYNKPLNLDPLKTTTTCSSSFNPFETKCLEFKHSTDQRTNEEFIENVHHHVKFNSDPDSGEYQRQQMILKLLRNLHQNAAIFKSKGYVSKETIKETEKQTQEQKDKLLWSAYQGYVKSPIEKKLRDEGQARLESFEEWKLKQCTK